MITRSQSSALDALLTMQNATTGKNGNTARLLMHTAPKATATLSPEKINTRVAYPTPAKPAIIPARPATSPARPAMPLASINSLIQALTPANAIVPAIPPAKTATIPAISPAMIRPHHRPLTRPHSGHCSGHTSIRHNTTHPHLFRNSSRSTTSSDHSGKNSGHTSAKLTTIYSVALTARLARVKNEKIRNFRRKYSTPLHDNPTGHNSGHVPATHAATFRPLSRVRARRGGASEWVLGAGRGATERERRGLYRAASGRKLGLCLIRTGNNSGNTSGKKSATSRPPKRYPLYGEKRARQHEASYGATTSSSVGRRALL